LFLTSLARVVFFFLKEKHTYVYVILYLLHSFVTKKKYLLRSSTAHFSKQLYYLL